MATKDKDRVPDGTGAASGDDADGPGLAKPGNNSVSTLSETPAAPMRARRGPVQWKLHADGDSNIGKRDVNEDSWLIDEERGIFIVADGLGDPSHGNGDTASLLAANAAHRKLTEYGAPSQDAVDQAIWAASHALVEAVEGNHDLSGMATTLVIVWIYQGVAWIGHVGDSWCYWYSAAGTIAALTTPHTVAQQFRDLQAAGSQVDDRLVAQHEHILHQCLAAKVTVGGDVVFPEFVPDISSHPLLPGDKILACTDGLDPVEEDLKLKTLHEGDDPLTEAQQLVEAGVLGGGTNADNATAIVIHVDEEEAPTKEESA